MTPPPTRPISTSHRLSEGLLPIVVGVISGFVGWFFTTTAGPSWPYATWAGWCFVAMGLAAIGIGIAGLVARSFPTLQSTTLDGQPAVGIRSWWGAWGFSWAADALLALLGLGAIVVDVMTGSRNLVVTIPAALFGAWLAIRLVLYAIGAKRMEAVWLTRESLIHERRSGVEVAPLSTITSVEVALGRVLVRTSVPPQQRLCPRLWRSNTADKSIVIAAATMGHSAEDIAEWIRDAVPSRT